MSFGSKGVVFEQDRKYVELLAVMKLVTDKLWALLKLK